MQFSHPCRCIKYLQGFLFLVLTKQPLSMKNIFLKQLLCIICIASVTAFSSCSEESPDDDDDDPEVPPVETETYFINATIDGTVVELGYDTDAGYNLDFHISPGVSEPIACNEVGGGLYWDDFLGGVNKGTISITMPYQCNSDYSYYDDDDFFHTLFDTGDWPYDDNTTSTSNGMTIQWLDPAGNLYASNYGAQDADAFFNISTSEAVEDNDITGNAAHEIRATFKCTLYSYDGTSSISLTDGETWLVFNNI